MGKNRPHDLIYYKGGFNKGGGWLTSPRWWSEAKQESSARKRFEADPHPTSDRDPRAQGMAREGEASGWGTPSRYNVYNVLKIQWVLILFLLLIT